MPTFVGMTTLCDRASTAAIIRQQCLSNPDRDELPAARHERDWFGQAAAQ
ncbi:MAG TPA: hypothetical protein VGG99_21805 [Acetobacteraceae bacterium]|jgi:hypothetical protein